jgi:hypothetical protein
MRCFLTALFEESHGRIVFFLIGLVIAALLLTHMTLCHTQDYAGAAADLKTTLWCKQVASRCPRDTTCLTQ